MRALAKGTYRSIVGAQYGTPKEMWGFRSARGKQGPVATAKAFLLANATVLGLHPRLRGLERQRVIRSLGASHVIFQQRHLKRRVHRAYVTVHVGNDDRVFLVKNRAVPSSLTPPRSEFDWTRAEAVRKVRSVFRKKAGSIVVQDTEPMWFPKQGKLIPTWRVRLARRRPREEWIVYVNARTGGILSRYDNLAAARGRGKVFQPSPVTALGDHRPLLTKKGNPRKPPEGTYEIVTLWSLGTNGRLEGKRVTTRPTVTRRRVRRSSRQFLFESREKGFEEVMVYHHIDSAIRYLEHLGYRGAKAIFKQPVRVDVNGTREDQSWYSPWDRLLTFGTGAIDDAEDGETILHELGHALEDAICPDFGQSEEAAAMGEGFGDYWAASQFADVKPPEYRPCVMTWDGLLLGLQAQLDPPCLRRVDEAWTYDDFISGDDEHDNGEIWSATLWDVRRKLGGVTADRLIIESHFQLDAYTTFARGARAILDADRNLNRGRNRNALRQIFRRRRIGPL